jgi:hypothetical protein
MGARFYHRGRTWEIAMSDVKPKRGLDGAQFIRFEGDDEIEYWTGRFGVARERLEKAIEHVGPAAQAVARYLKRRLAE